MRNILKYLLLVVVLTSCGKDIERNIIDKVSKEFINNPKKNHILDLKDVTKFQWDKVYLIQDWTTSDSIALITGLKYNGNDVKDDYTRMLFVSKNQIVHEENFRSLDYNKSTICFQTDSNTNFYTQKDYLRPTESKFMVEQSKIKGSCKECFFYSLIPLLR